MTTDILFNFEENQETRGDAPSPILSNSPSTVCILEGNIKSLNDAGCDESLPYTPNSEPEARTTGVSPQLDAMDSSTPVDTMEAEFTAPSDTLPSQVLPLYCICRQPDNNQLMICCDGCSEWSVDILHFT